MNFTNEYLLQLLEKYKEKLLHNELTAPEKLNLITFTIHDHNTDSKTIIDYSTITNEDIQKFTTLGWFVYRTTQ